MQGKNNENGMYDDGKDSMWVLTPHSATTRHTSSSGAAGTTAAAAAPPPKTTTVVEKLNIARPSTTSGSGTSTEPFFIYNKFILIWRKTRYITL